MKFMIQLMLILSTSSAFAANSAAIELVKSLGLKHYSCVLKGTGAEEGKRYPIHSTVPVVASDETDAVKLCLLSVKAHQFMASPDGDKKINFLAEGPNGMSMFVNDIEILEYNFVAK